MMKNMILAVPVLIIVSTILAFAGGNPSGRSHSFSDVESYAKRMDGPRRASWQKPDEVLKILALKKGDHVADVGAGTGYFARRFARAVGPEGSVTGYDTEKNMVEYMRKDAKKLGLDNYHAETVSGKNPVYPENRFDVIFMCNTYHHIEDADRVALLRALGKALKGKGRIVILDHKMTAPYGPPKHLRIKKERAIGEFTKAGFVLLKDEDFLPEQYYLEFRKK